MDTIFNNEYYEKIFAYFYSKKNTKYKLVPVASQTQKVCKLQVSIPNVPEFVYGAILNPTKNSLDEHIVVWDVFNTGQFYVNSNIYDNITHFKASFPIFYIFNLDLTSNVSFQGFNIFSVELGDSSNESPISQNIGEKTFIYYRYKDDYYDGWAFNWGSLFSAVDSDFLEEDQNSPQLELPFEVESNLDINDLTQDTLSKLLKNLSQDIGVTNKKISKLITTTKISKQAKNLLSQIDQMNQVSSDSKHSSSICSNFTCVSKSSSINIISKDHAFANAPEGFTYCSHPNAGKSFNDTIALCPWSVNQQSACSLYSPKSELIERRNSIDNFGNLLYDFQVSLDTLSNFNNVIIIKNMINNEIVNTITYPSDAKKEDVVLESIRVLDELVLSWSDTLQNNTNTILPQIEPKIKKQSYILSLA